MIVFNMFSVMFILYGVMIVPPPNIKGRIRQDYVFSDILHMWCHVSPRPLPI